MDVHGHSNFACIRVVGEFNGCQVFGFQLLQEMVEKRNEKSVCILKHEKPTAPNESFRIISYTTGLVEGPPPHRKTQTATKCKKIRALTNMTLSPLSMATLHFLAQTSTVSPAMPNPSRLSEWPTMVQTQPMALLFTVYLVVKFIVKLLYDTGSMLFDVTSGTWYWHSTLVKYNYTNT